MKFLKSTERLSIWYRKTETVNWLLMGVIFASGLLSRLHRQSEVSVWLDEAWVFYSLFEPESSALSILSISGLYNNFVFALSFLIDMHSESNLRALSLVLGSLTAVLVFRLMCKYSGIPVAVLASVMVIMSPLLITYSQDASVYIFCSTIVTLQFFIFIKWTNGFKLSNAVLFGVIAFTAINTRPQIVFFTFVLVMATLFMASDDWKQKYKSIFLACVVMCPSLYAIFEAVTFVQLTGNVSNAVFDLDSLTNVYRVVMTSLFNLPNPITLYSPQTGFTLYYNNAEAIRLIFVSLFLASLGFFVIKKQFHFVTLGLALIAFIALTSYSILKSGQLFERYLLILQPLVIIFLLVSFVQLVENMKWTQTIAIPFIFIVLVFWGNMSLRSSYGAKIAWKPPHKKAFELIKSHLSDTSTSTCIVPYFFEWPIAKYYLQNESNISVAEMSYNFFADLDGAVLKTPEEYLELTLAQVSEAKHNNTEQIFIYTRRGKNMLPDIQTYLDGQYDMSGIYETPSITVHRYLRTKRNDTQ